MDLSKNPIEFLYKKETHRLIGLCMKAHNKLGHGFLEVVYKDAIQIELKSDRIEFEREKEYKVEYAGTILPHKFYADFVAFDKIVLEVKSAYGGFCDDDIAQVINYLKVSGCKIGLAFQFWKESPGIQANRTLR